MWAEIILIGLNTSKTQFLICFEKSIKTFSEGKAESRDDEVVRALASHQCGPASYVG